MLRFIIPRIALNDLWPMIIVAVCGALVAGGYGIVHDQMTYAISEEYFSKLKFDQFRWADVGLPDRLFVAEIGFLATWWVGFFCAWFLGRRVIPNQPRRRAVGQVANGCAIVFVSTLLCGIVGFGYGLWRGPEADYSYWEQTLYDLGIEQKWAFIRVAYIHIASYVGGLTGLVLALVFVRPVKKLKSEAAAVTDAHSRSEQGGDPNGLESLAKYTQMPMERIQYYAESDTTLIAEIEHGILFIMAFWSGPSVKAFGEITEIINRLDRNATLQFVVIDTDGAQPFYEHPDFVGKMGGWGEIAWIKDGAVQCMSGLGYNPDCFEPNTKALLDTP